MGALQNSKANFKFVVLNSPFANPVATRDNFAFSANERKILSDFLVFAKIPGSCVFIGKQALWRAFKADKSGRLSIVRSHRRAIDRASGR